MVLESSRLRRSCTPAVCRCSCSLADQVAEVLQLVGCKPSVDLTVDSDDRDSEVYHALRLKRVAPYPPVAVAQAVSARQSIPCFMAHPLASTVISSIEDLQQRRHYVIANIVHVSIKRAGMGGRSLLHGTRFCCRGPCSREHIQVAKGLGWAGLQGHNANPVYSVHARSIVDPLVAAQTGVWFERACAQLILVCNNLLGTMKTLRVRAAVDGPTHPAFRIR